MIDEAESEDDRKLLPSQSMIAEPITTGVKPCTVNQNSISIKRTLSSLPGKLEIATSPDRTVCRTNLHPAREIHSLDGKKGFSSITITARRYITSSFQAPKEITSDPASSQCRSNDLLMKASVLPVEHKQQCRFLDNGADSSQNFKPFGLIYSQERPCWPRRVLNMEVSHEHLKDANHTTFISGVHVKRDQTFPGTIYYRHRLFSLSLGQCHAANQRTYKSEMSFRVKRPRKGRLDHTLSKNSLEPSRQVFGNDLEGEHEKCNPVEHEQPNSWCDMQPRSFNGHQRKQEQQGNCYHSDPCQDVSNYLNTDGEHQSQNSFEPSRQVFGNHLEGEHKKCSPIGYQQPNSWRDRQPRSLNEHQRNQAQQGNCYHPDPCQDVSNYINTDAFDFPQILKKDPPPVSEIYAESCAPLPGFGHPGAERSNVTIFNFIFGKQISDQGKNKLNSQKENIPLKGYKWSKSCGNIGENDKENMPLPEGTENKLGSKSLHEKMSLQEALEHHRPDFIYNSQERVHKLELMARRRKIQKQDPKLTAKKSVHQKRKIFTVPHPLSDNLFRPKERAISEREMQQRSKRIYNSLPEVKRKKEEEEMRIITQSNRVRAQLFKKKILDQILQRSMD